jgi:hypothetical protein
MHEPVLTSIDLPDFGRSDERPVLPADVYAARLDALRERAERDGYDRLVVYADREHSANLAWLTGFDPRFEEAILIVAPVGDPLILVGNECYGMAGAAALPMRRELHQDLSLPGQPRDRSRGLDEILAGEGITHGTRVGVIGWKTYATRASLETPAFLVDELRRAVGSTGLVENATGLLIDADHGLRTVNEVDQLAVLEWAACRTSDGVRRVLFGLRPGLRESEAVGLLEWDGTPLSCHLMLSAGERARLGLLSPGDRPLEHGDPFTVAFGIWGALNCRAGFVVGEASELPDDRRAYVERLVGPYFAAVAEWYGALRVGQTGGALHEIVERRLGDPFFGIFLNPGHMIGLDEWVNSPIARGSTTELRSGTALQVDIIPATGGPFFTTNIEDGLALADAGLRRNFAAAHPHAWERIQARRSFMANALGIELHPDVLPFSNLPAYLPPFLLRPDRAMTVAAS